MDLQADITKFLERIAAFALAVQRKLSWLVSLGFIASVFLAWQAYSPDSQIWWNLFKSGLIMLPSLIWVFVWSVLGQLQEAPTLAATLAGREDGVFANLQSSGLEEKSGISSVFSTLRAFRQEQGIGVVLDTIGSVTLLGNPLFGAFAFIMAGMLLILIVIAFSLLIF